ncbi:LytR/AlgR family response regulator transcription factor [Taibaiella soli]|uniref:DNA-binding response regulator n=1 Tax=Taibaiella soli TaxID=1649169 RepID=A0A2W2B444_9BACT|nr:LytTR family DNA-binding domain-containing protein [Taibaiella soli]PZF74808.1 hypothetical protein DN068_01015 [Taibaiella soli]
MKPFHFKALIVDDEKTACENLKSALQALPDVHAEIVGVAHNTREAEALISRTEPQVVFMDIDMPNENGFQFLNRIAPFPFEVIFVTAYDEYAIRAFKLNAIDYILKPIDIEDLKKAIEKLAEKFEYLEYKANSNIAFGQMQKTMKSPAGEQQIVLRDNRDVEIVSFRKIVYVEAMRSYSKVVFYKDNVEKNIIVSQSVAEYQEIFPSDLFFRTHKSFLVNCTFIDKILKEDDLWYVSLKNKVQIPVGRRRYQDLLEFLKTKEWHVA